MRQWWLVVCALTLGACKTAVVEPDAGQRFDAGFDSGLAAEVGANHDGTGSKGDAGWPECPANVLGTGDVAGATLTREGFGCYGGCGPSCKAECLEDTLTTTLTGTHGCTRCIYRVTTCKSHELCRWHDDCYRQCDLRWAEGHAAAPASPPSNPCYLTCDNPVVQASAVCGADWSQLLASSSPSVRDACWDGSFVVLTTLTARSNSGGTAACTVFDDRARPWAPKTGRWSHAASVPSELPRGYSCGGDTDCPDRNQRCDPKAGDYPGINGWGRCVDLSPFPGIDVRPWPAPGTRLVAPGLDGGAQCLLGYDCASSRCDDQRCR